MLSSGLSKHDLGKFNLEEQVHLFLISSYADDQGQVGVKVKSRSTIKPRFVTRNGRYGVLLTISKFYSDNKRCRSAPPPFFCSWRKTPSLDITFSSPVSSPERPSSPLLNPPGSPADSSAHARAIPPMPLAHSARSLPARLHRRSARHLLLYTPRRRQRVHARTAPICTRRRVLRPSGPWYGMAMLRRASRAGPGWTASAPVMVQRAPAGPGRPGLLAWPGSGLGR